MRIRKNHVRHVSLPKVLEPLAKGEVAIVHPLVIGRRRQRIVVASVRGEDFRARDRRRAFAEPLARGAQALTETVLLTLFRRHLGLQLFISAHLLPDFVLLLNILSLSSILLWLLAPLEQCCHLLNSICHN